MKSWINKVGILGNYFLYYYISIIHISNLIRYQIITGSVSKSCLSSKIIISFNYVSPQIARVRLKCKYIVKIRIKEIRGVYIYSFAQLKIYSSAIYLYYYFYLLLLKLSFYLFFLVELLKIKFCIEFSLLVIRFY